MSADSEDKLRIRSDLGTIANLTVIGLVAYALIRPTGPIGEAIERRSNARLFQGIVAQNWASLSGGPRLDTTSAAVALVEFSDYECPFCRKQHAPLKRLLDDENVGGVAFRHYPLPIHEHAAGAALTAICAERVGRFRQMHERLFTTTAWMQDTNWVREAKAVGITDIAAFAACRASKLAAARLNADIGLAQDLQLNGTPAFVSQASFYQGFMDDSVFLRVARKSSKVPQVR